MQVIASGVFTSDGTTKQIALRSGFDVFEVLNQTQIATTQATGRGCKFEWQAGMADNTGVMFTKQNASNAIDLEWLTTGGFREVDTSDQTLGAAKATSGTDVSQANPAVVTVTAHGYSNGDRIRIYGTTGMLQIAGMDFTIGSVAANDFTLAYLDSSGFAAAATAGFVRKVPNSPQFAPRTNWITAITKATAAVVTLSVTHGLSVGEYIKLSVPAEFGMVEANGLTALITAVNTTTNTVTLDLDSTSFTTFAFPTSAVAAGGVSPAIITPAGDNASLQSAAGSNQNVAQIVMELAAGADSPAGSNGDVIYWRALKSDITFE